MYFCFIVKFYCFCGQSFQRKVEMFHEGLVSGFGENEDGYIAKTIALVNCCPPFRCVSLWFLCITLTESGNIIDCFSGNNRNKPYVPQTSAKKLLSSFHSQLTYSVSNKKPNIYALWIKIGRICIQNILILVCWLCVQELCGALWAVRPLNQWGFHT